MTAPTPSTPSAEVRLAFWNTWLLAPRMWRTGPRIRGMKGWFAPNVEERAPLVGKAVAGRFDIAALSECFEESEHAAVAAAWPEAELVVGPQRRKLKRQGSGLATLLGPGATLARSAMHAFRSGGDLRDSDNFATKGALFTRVHVHPDLPPVEVVSTHLLAGGDLLPIPGANDSARHHIGRMAQVDELLGFVEREHDPACVLVVMGDFNVDAHDPDLRLSDPAVRYRDLATRMTAAGLRDVWRDHGVGPGHTCTFDHPDDLPADPDEPDRLVDDPDAKPITSPGHRIDYLWLKVPAALNVDIGRPRRWAFSGRGVLGGPAGSLSDHLALSVTLQITPA